MTAAPPPCAGSLHLRAITALVAAVHFVVALLDLDDRAGWSFRPYPSMVGIIADHPFWTWLNLGAGFLVIVSLLARRHRAEALDLSAGILAVWGGFLYAWALQLDHPPVSLLGPALMLGFAAAAVIAAHAWASQE